MGPSKDAPTEDKAEMGLKAMTFKQLGNKAIHSKNFSAAAEFYSEAIKISPKEKELFTNRAVALMGLAKFDWAMEDAKRATELDPDWAKGHYRLGQAYRGLGDLAEAGASFWEACRLDPSSEDARRQFQLCLESAKKQRGE
mmetsp:Transcript_24067/g.37760  ORF Transcript_24067/g.37760 Transcript_24067/m.37760 type:complete len:141 (-) Transcript_24067:1912-2334(-)